MIRQYPYVLQVKHVTAGSQKADGSFNSAVTSWVNLARCRDESGNGKKVAVEDGSVREFSFLIQMPRGVPALEPGTEVQVLDGSTVRAKGKVLYSRQGQLHTQAWL